MGGARFLVCGLLLASGPAAAATYQTVVVPFEASPEIRYELPVAMELELELVESVVVKSNKRVWAELRKKKDRKFEASVLKKIMKRRKLDILITGRTVDDVGPELEIIAYGKDGKPRIIERFDYPDDIDETAAVIVERLTPQLNRWGKLKRATPRVAAAPAPDGFDEEDDATGDDDLFVDPEADRKKSKKKKKKKSKLKDDVDDNWDDAVSEDDDAPRKKKKRKKKKKKKKRSAFDDDEPARSNQNKTKRRLIGDDEDDDERRSRLKSAGKNDEADEVRLTHYVMAAGGIEAGSWLYQFAGSKESQSTGFWARVYPSGNLRADVWPIEWVGADVTLRGSAVPFCIGDPGLFATCEEDANARVTPRQFWAYRASAHVAAKARYVFDLGPVGAGIGARAGYRYSGVFVERQTNVNDNQEQTLVPGHQWHALTLGSEFYAALRLLGRRFELELKADLIPGFPPYSLLYYAETPDSPGQQWWVIGGVASATVRLEVIFGVFVDINAFGAGGYVTYNGTGNRRGELLDTDIGGREFLIGGQVINVDGGASVGVGWFF